MRAARGAAGLPDRPLPRSFYARETTSVARDLLGRLLVRVRGGASGGRRGSARPLVMSGIITETEAYGSSDDPASHAYRGMSKRNRAMFGTVGTAYVYFTYGMHYCVNAVARAGGSDAGAVLIRSVRPVAGADLMMRNRGRDGVAGLADGPAKLTMAMQIDKAQYGADLTDSDSGVYIAAGSGMPEGAGVSESGRIGIRHGVEKMWNFKIG